MNIQNEVLNKDIHTIASQLGLKKQRARQILYEAIKKGIRPEAVRRGDNGRLLYSESFVKKVADYYVSKPYSHAPRITPISPPHVMSIEVPIFNDKIRALLMLRFGTEAAVVTFLKGKLEEEIKEELRSDLELLMTT